MKTPLSQMHWLRNGINKILQLITDVIPKMEDTFRTINFTCMPDNDFSRLGHAVVCKT